jgi:23S rRNA pseudouridine1911/1915/1917 synthase
MLHASVLAFVHPRTGLEVHFESPWPEDFREALRVLRLEG